MKPSASHAVEGALGSIGRETRGVGSETVEMMRPNRQTERMGGGGADNRIAPGAGARSVRRGTPPFSRASRRSATFFGLGVVSLVLVGMVGRSEKVCG